MRQGGFKAICLFLAFLSVSGVLFADDTTVNMESRIVQSFDEPEKEPWFLLASNFATKDYPKMAYVKSWPISLFGSNTENKDLRVLGVSMLFDRKEYNWVDIIPGTVDKSGEKPVYKPKEISLPGRVKALDMWVWGSGFNYYIEAYVRDYKGIVYILPMGDLSFIGWRNLRTNIPDNVPQSKRYLPKKESLTLVKFRVWTRPSEVVAVPAADDAAEYMRTINIYFDQIKVLTDTFETLYDGDALSDPSKLKEAWGSSETGK